MSVGTTEITLNLVPPSLNKAMRGRGREAHRKKKEIEEQLVWLFIAAALPKGLTSVRAFARLRFPTRHRRDPDNFGYLIGKALGDALAPHSATHPHRWLPDDTAQYYQWVTPVEFEEEIGAPRTVLTLEWCR